MGKVDIAVFGASGFIGSNLVNSLTRDGYSVLAIDIKEPQGDFRKNAWESASHRMLIDLRNTALNLLGATEAYNLAADMGGVGYFHKYDFQPYINNSRITFNVLETCIEQKVQKLFMASSACIYPIEIQTNYAKVPKLSEDLIETGQPDQMYGREKLMMLRLAERAPLDCRVGIYHGIYGIGQETKGERMKFPTSIATKMLEAVDTNIVEIWGNGKQSRSFQWIDDAITKTRNLMDGPNIGPTNIGKEGALTISDFAHICAEILKIRPEYKFSEDKPTGVVSRDCDNSKYWKNHVKFNEKSYEEGFTYLLNWLRTEN